MLVNLELESGTSVGISFSNQVWTPLATSMTKEGLLWPEHNKKGCRMTTLMVGRKKIDKGGHCSGTRVSHDPNEPN